MENLEIIPGVLSVADNPDDVTRVRILQEQLWLLVHAEWCYSLQMPRTACNIPHCSTICDVHRPTGKCRTGMDCTMPQCVSSRRLVLHFCDCEDQQCSVCEPMKNATERRFYSVERDAGQTNRTFTLTRKERGKVIYGMLVSALFSSANAIRTMQIADSPDLTDVHNLRAAHAIRHVKCFEHYAYNKASVVEEYDNLIENYVLCRDRLLARHRFL
ncbi:unnamed protein product [Taenia asiatica]|uniref:histone acetyltransferase n=1 Tax=Taenia asiatica TaxID=60517 RepID=A0A0R3WGT6_TAEAS|nr:unnamed protein product [Taenia asiatica]